MCLDNRRAAGKLQSFLSSDGGFAAPRRNGNGSTDCYSDARADPISDTAKFTQHQLSETA